MGHSNNVIKVNFPVPVRKYIAKMDDFNYNRPLPFCSDIDYGWVPSMIADNDVMWSHERLQVEFYQNKTEITGDYFCFHSSIG